MEELSLEDDEEDTIPLPSLEEQLKHLSVVSRMYEAQNIAIPDAHRALQNALRTEQKKRMVQTSIMDYFQ